jgi:hypothetical protein
MAASMTPPSLSHGRRHQQRGGDSVEDGFSGLPGEAQVAPTAYRSVGYPAMLAGVISDRHQRPRRGLLAPLGAATCVLFTRRPGSVRLACRPCRRGILAFFPSQVFLPTLLMTEIPWTFLTMLLLALTLVLTLRGSTSWLPVAVLGLAFGAASLVRGEMLAFPLILVAVWAIANRSGRTAFAWRRRRRRDAGRAAPMDGAQLEELGYQYSCRRLRR